mmetsp:Transcript_24392/g.70372  ORF Transcript_24392/g.70372 Transcript_24392/m.70372 type:complete len:328 (+) Transcript_24392:64-1047(+)
MGFSIVVLLSLLFGVRTSHGLRGFQRHPAWNIHVDEFKGVVAWVNFGKTGSSSLAHVLAQRHKEHGWAKDRFSVRGLCRAKREQLHWKTRKLPHCHKQPDGAVIATDFGYCDLLRSTRECRYMTVLREPIARMISSYNYFCLRCSEGGKACAKAQGPGAVTCPKMSIVQFAKHFGNEYVRMFAGKDRRLCQQSLIHASNITSLKSSTMAEGIDDVWTMDMISRQSCRADFEHAGDQDDESDYQHAVQVLTKSSTLVLCSRSLLPDDASGLQQLAHFLHDNTLEKKQLPLIHSLPYLYKPTDDEIREISKILDSDSRLYAAFCRSDGP